MDTLKQEAISLIEKIYKLNGNSEFDICDIDGGSCRYLVGNRELRWISASKDDVCAESNIVHKVDENGYDIECEYETFHWKDMTTCEKEELVYNLNIYYETFSSRLFG